MKKDFILNFIFTIFTGVIMFLQNKYFIEYMGIETLGIMKLFTQLLQYLNIVEMGLENASAFALYKPLAEKNYKQVSIILSTIKSIYNKIALLLFGLGILLTPILPFFMKVKFFDKIMYVYWILYVLNTVSTYLFIKYVILFIANQEFIYVRFIQSLSKFIYQTLQIWLIIKYHSFLIFIILLILDNLTQYILLKRHFDKSYSFVFSTKERYIGLNKDIKNLFWHKIGTLVVFNTDLILISKLVSIKVVGIYANYQLVIQMITTIINIGVNVIRPKIGKYIAINSKEKTYRLFKKINMIFLLIGIVFSYCSYILINYFISLWIGKEYILSNFIVQLICINIFVACFRVILDIFKDGSGFFDDIQSPILESIINLVFSIILGIKYGLNGIIIGTIISNISITLIYKPILTFKRCFNKDLKEYIKVYGNYLILTVISLLSLNKIIKIFIVNEINSWLNWILYSIKISIITSIILIIVFLLNKDFRSILKEIYHNFFKGVKND
ncbi:lipopolysaccharide biosynthesis protein [Fusobacterium sp.]|uniref:lipopolysaccharide biosynthesis protein n=1 Tax=Fusobacterium sp. TaxID=68766 RepID=UPI002E7682D2|nr:polysaccharide biosynthesis protein [Fusobacterium sp.]MEE1475926.1 polysaccharide biosynthesis protein [Fusobacterium sp.]